MYFRFFPRYSHSKASLPELDFTKPTSDRLKKLSFKDSNDPESLLKVPLRGQCLFGLYPIELALQTNRRQFYQLYLSQTSNETRPMMEKIQHLAEQLSIPIQYTNTKILDSLSFNRPHQGVCLDCSALPIQDIERANITIDPNRISLDLCLVQIHDPMNLGGIIRTAHFFGIDRIILTRGSCQPSPVASKTSSGALELMSIYTCNDLQTYLHKLQEQTTNALVCATHQGNIPLQILRLDDMKKTSSNLQRITVLIGNEHEGIPEDIIQMCHYNVRIQAHGDSEISSLNASVASALFLYHISAQMKRKQDI